MALVFFHATVICCLLPISLLWINLQKVEWVIKSKKINAYKVVGSAWLIFSWRREGVVPSPIMWFLSTMYYVLSYSVYLHKNNISNGAMKMQTFNSFCKIAHGNKSSWTSLLKQFAMQLVMLIFVIIYSL